MIGCSQTASTNLVPTGLTCEYVKNPKVVDKLHPRLAWINQPGNEDFRGQIQTAYQIRVASSKDLLSSPDLWDSGKMNSESSHGIKYQGKPLESRQDCWWQVRIWDKDSQVSDWSRPATWSMGLMEESDWLAKWIGAPWQGEEALPELGWPDAPLEERPPPAPFFRKEFSVSKQLASAKAYVTGLGYFEFYVNGKKQGDEVLVPNQTNYGKRNYLMETNIPLPDDFQEYKVMYLAYDITDQLVPGKNALGAILGNGFYDASKYWSGSYGSPRFIGQIHLDYQDGTSEVIVSDESWRASTGPIIMDMVYYGEIYDARLEQPGWSSRGFDDSSWQTAAIREKPYGKLVAHTPYPDKITKRLEPVSVKKLDSGKYQVDFGEEISGWVKLIDVSGPPGHQIDIKFISNTPSGDNSYIFGGEGKRTYAPRFNWFVFSAVEIHNWPGELTADQIVAEMVNTYVEESAEFQTSNQMFNDINEIWKRSQLDNMHGGIASDCPHRERSGYTGDAQVACATVMHNFDARSFYDKWIADMRGSQIVSTGYVPNCAPWQPGCGGGVAWGAAICIIPWEFYLQYGALDVLQDNYQAMKSYVDYMKTWVDDQGIMLSQRKGKDGKVLKWFNLGDWSCVEDECPPDDMVHTYFFWKCVQILEQTAGILDQQQDQESYKILLQRTADAFHQRFYDPAAKTYGANGGNIFALDIGVPEDNYSDVIDAIKRNMEANDGHLDTGIFGTELLFETLSEHHMHQLAFEAMNKETMPSYGYWLEDGATTTREAWDGGGSHNHPMFGGGLTWFYRNLAGMRPVPDKPGYKHIVFKPQPVPGMERVSYFNETVYGNAGISWEQTDQDLMVTVRVPVGSVAELILPANSSDSISESGVPLGESEWVKLIGSEPGEVTLEVSSGIYRFKISNS